MKKSTIPRSRGTIVAHVFEFITTGDFDAAAKVSNVDVKGDRAAAIAKMNQAMSGAIAAEIWTTGGDAREWSQALAKKLAAVAEALEQVVGTPSNDAANRAAAFLANGVEADLAEWNRRTRNLAHSGNQPPDLIEAARQAIFGVVLLGELATIQGTREAKKRPDHDERILIDSLCDAFEVATLRKAAVTVTPGGLGPSDQATRGGTAIQFMRSALGTFARRLDGDLGGCNDHTRRALPEFLASHRARADAVRGRLKALTKPNGAALAEHIKTRRSPRRRARPAGVKAEMPPKKGPAFTL